MDCAPTSEARLSMSLLYQPSNSESERGLGVGSRSPVRVLLTRYACLTRPQLEDPKEDEVLL